MPNPLDVIEWLSAHTVDKWRSPAVVREPNDVVINEPHGPGDGSVGADSEPVKKIPGPTFDVNDLQTYGHEIVAAFNL